MRLHNRQLKGEFFSDPDILQWPRDKRFFYAGLIQIADDSGCLDDNEFSFKLLIFPSPRDEDLTTEQLSIWKKELIDEGKLMSYTSKRKKCLYLCNFRKHQKLKNPSAPTVPLPEWVSWIPSKTNEYAGKYSFNQDIFNSILYSSENVLNNDFDSSCEVLGNSLESSYEVLSNTLQDSYEGLTDVYQPKPKPQPKENTDDDDNARAREEVESREHEANAEDFGNPGLPMEEESAKNDYQHVDDGFTLVIGLDSSAEDHKKTAKTACALGTKAIDYAEANFGRPLSPTEIQRISDFCIKFSERHSRDPDSIVIEALRRCFENEPRNKLKYLDRIMHEWLDHGVAELSDIRKLDAEWEDSKLKAANTIKGGTSNEKNFRNHGTRIDDPAAYDPSAWAKAGFSVST